MKKMKTIALSLFRSSRLLPALLVAVLSLLLLLPLVSRDANGQTTPVNYASNLPYTFADLKSVDVMKYTKDVMIDQPSSETIENLVNTLAALPITHLAVALPMDPSSDYPSDHRPYPQDAYAFTQQWADAIHDAGLHIIWRGTWSGIEGIYGFPKQVGSNRLAAGTATSAVTDGNTTWLGKTYSYITSHPNFFANGDVWAPLPERTEGIFQDSTSFLPYSGAGIQANYVNFFNDLEAVSAAAFRQINTTVYTGFTANNYTEVLSGWLGQSLFDHNQIIAIDYYGQDHTALEMDRDLRAMAARYNHAVFLQEWGDYWNANIDSTARIQYLKDIYTTLNKLVQDGILIGFNYWGGWENNAEGILTQDSGGFHLNSRAQLLAEFFAGHSQTETVISEPTVVPVPTVDPVVISPAPSTVSEIKLNGKSNKHRKNNP